MKATLALLTLIFLMSFTLEANAKGFRTGQDENIVVQEVLGDLIVKRLNGHPEMKIRAYDREITLANVHTHWKSCLNGIFLITEDQENNGEARLLDVIECQEKINFDINAFDPSIVQPIYCPEIYMPVCGFKELEGTQEIETYSNLCKLNASKADFLHHGECHSL